MLLDSQANWISAADYEFKEPEVPVTPLFEGRAKDRNASQVIELEFSLPQYELITTDAVFPAFVGGFGSGKTAALIARTFVYKCKYFKLSFAYYMPTFDLVRTIAFPRFEEKLEEYKISYKLNKTFASIDIKDAGQIIFRTMDNPSRIVGYETADSALDEFDTLNIDDARMVWNKVLARNRQKKPDGARNTIAVGTTPEGYKFCYEQWQANPPSVDYKLIHASTYSNQENLPADYITNLKAQYPSNQILAYLDGKFVNLTGKTVYPEYDRKLNGSIATAFHSDILYIGMDFNVGNMSAIIHVMRGGDPHAVAEITGVLDTPAIIAAIKARWPNNQIYIYPDASGQNRKSSNASESDLSLLRAHFNVMVNHSNPFVKDRVLAMNCLFNAGGKRRYKINALLCPSYADNLEKQIWNKKGEPDKDSGRDHTNDAGGYFVCYTFPVRRSDMTKVGITGT